MSKYYCKNCNTEYKFNGDPPNTNNWCPICYFEYKNYPTKIVMQKLPDYETPEQYEKRTGKKWNGAVFYRCINDDCEEVEFTEWEIGGYIDIDPNDYPFCVGCESILAVCAQSPEPPPDDWKPEDGV